MQYVKASFSAVQPAVAAFVVRAVYKISEHALVDSSTNEFSMSLLLLASMAALQSVMRYCSHKLASTQYINNIVELTS